MHKERGMQESFIIHHFSITNGILIMDLIATSHAKLPNKVWF